MYNPFEKFDVFSKEPEKEDFLDLNFKITKREVLGDFLKINAVGYWHSNKIEIVVDKIPVHTNPTFVTNKENETKISQDAYKGAIEIVYTPALVACLSFYSGETLKGFGGNEKITPEILPLSDKEYDLSTDKGYFSYKIFIQSEENRPFIQDEEGYAEYFLNVDLDKMILELHEKDPTYRKPLLKLLTS